MKAQIALMILMVSEILGQTESNNGCISNCRVCNSSLPVCHQCGPGYYFNIDDFKCISIGSNSVIGCQLYLTREFCNTCNEGFQLDKGLCNQCRPKNCKTCANNALVCDQCLQTWSKSNVAAVDCDVQCQATNCIECETGSTSLCKTCSSGFRVTPAKSCERCTITQCLGCTTNLAQCDEKPLPAATCIDGYFYDYKLKTCTQCSSGCLTCNATGFCLGCDTAKGQTMDLAGSCVGNPAALLTLRRFAVICLIVYLLLLI